MSTEEIQPDYQTELGARPQEHNGRQSRVQWPVRVTGLGWRRLYITNTFQIDSSDFIRLQSAKAEDRFDIRSQCFIQDHEEACRKSLRLMQGTQGPLRCRRGRPLWQLPMGQC